MASWFRKPKYTTLAPPASRGRIPEGLLHKCPKCLESLVKSEWDEAHKVCPKCRYHDRLTARERVAQLFDENSFNELDAELVSGDPLGFVDSKPYPGRLREARKKSGLNEGVLGGTGRIHGRAVSIAIMDMNFIGGSMGCVAGEKIARAIERGLEHEIPVVLVCCSGGARMQEGILSLMQMAKACAIAGRLAQAGLPLVTILTDPTTGGVSASFALIGDVVIAEPNALIGFAGQRVIEATIKQVLPPGFQRSEFLADHGFVDVVCQRGELRQTVGTLLSLFMSARENPRMTGRPASVAGAALDRNLDPVG